VLELEKYKLALLLPAALLALLLQAWPGFKCLKYPFQADLALCGIVAGNDCANKNLQSLAFGG
jgi:hypothetical protein